MTVGDLPVFLFRRFYGRHERRVLTTCPTSDTLSSRDLSRRSLSDLHLCRSSSNTNVSSFSSNVLSFPLTRVKRRGGRVHKGTGTSGSEDASDLPFRLGAPCVVSKTYLKARKNRENEVGYSLDVLIGS